MRAPACAGGGGGSSQYTKSRTFINSSFHSTQFLSHKPLVQANFAIFIGSTVSVIYLCQCITRPLFKKIYIYTKCPTIQYYTKRDPDEEI